MFAHWQSRTRRVIVELDEKQSHELVADIELLTQELGYSTKLLEILLANVKEELKHA